MRLKNLKLVHQGKVRDIYELQNGNWLIVATDRVSAYDSVLPTEIPGRGIVLTMMSNFWMRKFEDLVPNHLVDTIGAHLHGSTDEEQDWLRGRSVEVRRLVPLKVEAIARGFLAGSGWAQYRDTGFVNGEYLPEGLERSQKLAQPIYTPSTKDEHDENISFVDTIRRGLLTDGKAIQVKSLTLQLYHEGAKHTASRGILCADTKFEFGTDPKDESQVYLMDEVLTPDSSRFWAIEDYKPGIDPPSYDKQIIRNYLDEIGWNRVAPAPALPEAVVAQVEEKYWDVLKRITGQL